MNLERNNQLRIQVQKFELRNKGISSRTNTAIRACLLYTSDAADEEDRRKFIFALADFIDTKYLCQGKQIQAEIRKENTIDYLSTLLNRHPDPHLL